MNMNKITILAVLASLSLVAMPLYADDAHHPEKAQKTTDAKASTPVTDKSADAEPATEQQIKRAQETMRKLQDQMGKIRQANDPKERQKLMQEHMQTMHEGMKQLRGMGGMKAQAGMMGMARDGKQGGMMMGGDMMKMHNMMEMRMEMMEMMMEQMMQREEMRGAMPAK